MILLVRQRMTQDCSNNYIVQILTVFKTPQIDLLLSNINLVNVSYRMTPFDPDQPNTSDTPGSRYPYTTSIKTLTSKHCNSSFEALEDGHPAKAFFVRVTDRILCAQVGSAGQDACNVSENVILREGEDCIAMVMDCFAWIFVLAFSGRVIFSFLFWGRFYERRLRHSRNTPE